MWFSLCLSVILLRSVSCVFTIKDWIGIGDFGVRLERRKVDKNKTYMKT